MYSYKNNNTKHTQELLPPQMNLNAAHELVVNAQCNGANTILNHSATQHSSQMSIQFHVAFILFYLFMYFKVTSTSDDFCKNRLKKKRTDYVGNFIFLGEI